MTKITSAHKGSSLVSVPKIAGGKDTAPAFTVSHYAGKVEYDTTLFLNKNTDPLHSDLVEMMQGSGCKYFQELFTPQAAPAASGGGGKASAAGIVVHNDVSASMQYAAGTPNMRHNTVAQPGAESNLLTHTHT